MSAKAVFHFDPENTWYHTKNNEISKTLYILQGY